MKYDNNNPYDMLYLKIEKGIAEMQAVLDADLLTEFAPLLDEAEICKLHWREIAPVE